MERKFENNKPSEHAKVVENPQVSTVYAQAHKLLDLFGVDTSSKSRNEGEDRQRAFSVETTDELGFLKLGVTSYLDNNSIMFYGEDQKGATRVFLNQGSILDTVSYIKNGGVLELNVEKK
jgi:hypothetical protein